MLELAVAGTAIAGLVALAVGHPDGVYAIDPRMVVDLSAKEGELPCPWCRSDTDESDTKCPSCGRRFG